MHKGESTVSAWVMKLRLRLQLVVRVEVVEVEAEADVDLFIQEADRIVTEKSGVPQKGAQDTEDDV